MKLAKSNGLSMKEHGEIVNIIGQKLTFMLKEDYLKYSNVIELCSKLHDIGKLTVNFQNILNGEDVDNFKYAHNEIGWAFLSIYLKDIEYKDIILHCTYWHHGIINVMNNDFAGDILNILSDDDINNMKEYLISVVGEDNVLLDDIDDYDIDEFKTPKFYDGKSVMPLKTLLLNILITSDRIGSGFNNIKDAEKYSFDKYFNFNNIIDDKNYKNCKYNGSDRFEKQLNIVNEIGNEQTTIIKAPAGFGKTILGLMWAIRHNKKLLWVVPRNTIAKSLYISILEELLNLGVELDVQLLLGGEVIKSNNNDNIPYNASIIVTNIDNFIAPTFKNSLLSKSSLINGTTVIFDEYHEFIDSAALFSAFINIMKIRHLYVNTHTLLLSATPININSKWQILNGNKTLILPNENSHYNAVHDYKYKIYSDLYNLKSYNESTLFITNSVSNSQKIKKTDKFVYLFHSKYLENVKNDKLNHLLNNYGKLSKPLLNKENVISTNILQASVNISFKRLIEHPLSPESTLQRIGRCDRFGSYKGGIIHFDTNINIDMKKSNDTVIRTMYDSELNKLWNNELIKLNNKEITLNTFYEIYNKFATDNKKLIKNYINSKYRESLKSLTNIYPLKMKFKKTDIKTAGGNKLRSTNTEIFYLVRNEEDTKWVGPFSKVIRRPFDIEFNENANTRDRIIKKMEAINKNKEKYPDLDYSEFLNKYKTTKTIDNIRRIAIKSNTPYFDFSRIYNKELGIIKK